MKPSLVAIDIGNSRVKVAIGDRASAGWERILTFASDPEKSADEWFSLLLPITGTLDRPVTGIVCCSVVPLVTGALIAAAERVWNQVATIVTSTSSFSISVSTDEPTLTGADRAVNTNSAWVRHGGPVIIVDCGSATKVDAVTGDGRFVGGAIAPGITMGMTALARGTAQLSAIVLDYPPQAIGGTTESALHSGVVRGHVRMIEGLVRDMQDELGGSCLVVVTGGAHPLVAPHLRVDTETVPTLTLDGLRLLAP